MMLMDDDKLDVIIRLNNWIPESISSATSVPCRIGGYSK